LLFARPAPAAPAPGTSLVRDLGFAKFKGAYDANRQYVFTLQAVHQKANHPRPG
jgi:hypothetical protein